MHFGGDPGAIGRPITLNMASYTVVGVFDPDIPIPILDQEPAFWIAQSPDDPVSRGAGGRVKVIARLRPGVEWSAAEGELASIQEVYQQGRPSGQRSEGVIIQTLREDRASAILPTLKLATLAVGTLLLIACSNVAGLLLNRTLERGHEIAVRLSLGASRFRVIRHLLTENFLLWMLGAGLGIISSYLAIGWLVGASPFGAEELPAPDRITIDFRALWFCCGVTLLTALIFGSLGACQGARLNLADGLKHGGRGAASVGPTHFWRSLLVATQVALSVSLLVSAALLVTSFAQLNRQRLGFEPEGLVTFKVTLPEAICVHHGKRLQFHDTLVRQLSALPGVEVASTTSAPPLGGIITVPFAIEGRALTADAGQTWAGLQSVHTDYFRAMGIQVVRGREFGSQDNEHGDPVVMINETLARKFFPAEDPLGRRIRHAGKDQPWMRIIGIVSDVKHAGLDWEYLPETFMPYRQVPGSYVRLLAANLFVAIRSEAGGSPNQALVRSTVNALGPNMPIVDFMTGERLVSASAARARFRAILIVALSSIAFLLTIVGLYGLLSQAVTQRRREFAIRLALGASPTSIVILVERRGILLASVGAALGVGAAYASVRLFKSLLFGVSPSDPLVIWGVAGLMIAVAATVSLPPSFRAVRVNLLKALNE
jgi:predicted permease